MSDAIKRTRALDAEYNETIENFIRNAKDSKDFATCSLKATIATFLNSVQEKIEGKIPCTEFLAIQAESLNECILCLEVFRTRLEQRKRKEKNARKT